MSVAAASDETGLPGANEVQLDAWNKAAPQLQPLRSAAATMVCTTGQASAALASQQHRQGKTKTSSTAAGGYAHPSVSQSGLCVALHALAACCSAASQGMGTSFSPHSHTLQARLEHMLSSGHRGQSQ